MKYFKQFLLLIIAVLTTVLCFSQDDIPEPPKPPRLVNDYINLLTTTERNQIEQKLVAFNDSTSTQIVIVITDDLKGYDAADFTDRILMKWGVGQKEKNNGIVILVKPTGGKGERKIHISVAYGLEGIIPDATAKKIIEYEMIPMFKENKFYEGLNKSTDILMGLASKEFGAGEYMNKHKSNPFLKLIPIVLIAFIFFLIRIFRTKTYASSKGISFLTAFLLMSSLGSRGSGGFGNFSSGGGGFGGFGGGCTGGGGAGGSW